MVARRLAGPGLTPRERALYRRFVLAGAAIIVLIRPLERATDPNTVDSWPLRLTMAAYALAIGLIAARVPARAFDLLLGFGFYLLTGWVLLLLEWNPGSWVYFVELLLLVGALAPMMRSRRQLLTYAAFVLVSLTLILARHSGATPIHPTHYLFLVGGLLFLDFLLLDARLRVEQELAESEERYMLAALGSNSGLFEWDLRTGLAIYTPRWRALLGLGPTDPPHNQRDWTLLLAPDERPHVEARLETLRPGVPVEFEHRIWHADGSWRWMLTRLLAVADRTGQIVKIVGSQTDITERKMAEEQLLAHAERALRDPLTGLPNRTLFLDRLGQAARAADREGGAGSAVLLLDLDRFKIVNDSLGHGRGDELLQAVARRLENGLRPQDTVARLGGDEFGLLLDDIVHPAPATRVAARILRRLRQPFLLGDQEVFVSASIGIAFAHESAETALREADTALHRAKARGGNTYELFNQAMHAEAMALLRVENELTRALERQEFVLHYQPIVDLQNGHLVGFEALLRWRHPERGLVLPGEFLALAEEIGWGAELGRWVFETACRQLAEWRRSCEPANGFHVNVNVAPRHFHQPDLIDHLRGLLRDCALDPRTLHVEITETLVMQDPDEGFRRLSRLKDLGLRLALDDFGTGYSSLAYLERFPFDVLKIDRSFVAALPAHGSAARTGAVVESVMRLAQALALETVGEGVETEEQWRALRDLGCRYGQGYLFGPPLDAEAATELVRRRGMA